MGRDARHVPPMPSAPRPGITSGTAAEHRVTPSLGSLVSPLDCYWDGVTPAWSPWPALGTTTGHRADLGQQPEHRGSLGISSPERLVTAGQAHAAGTPTFLSLPLHRETPWGWPWELRHWEQNKCEPAGAGPALPFSQHTQMWLSPDLPPKISSSNLFLNLEHFSANIPAK